MILPPKGQLVPLPELCDLASRLKMFDVLLVLKTTPPPLPFSSDGLSMFPDRIGLLNLYPAGFRHDLRYYVGKPRDERKRFIADCLFAIDLVEICGASPELAATCFAGVRMGGKGNTKLPWRYGFGGLT